MDALVAHYQSYDRQSSNYRMRVIETNSNIMCIESGPRPGIEHLLNDCRRNQNIAVANKVDLLRGTSTLTGLEQMSWGEQEVADLEVMRWMRNLGTFF